MASAPEWAQRLVPVVGLITALGFVVSSDVIFSRIYGKNYHHILSPLIVFMLAGALVAGMYAILGPRGPVLEIPPAAERLFLFRASPVFTPERKARIATDLLKFRSYLLGLGLELPEGILPIDVGPSHATNLDGRGQQSYVDYIVVRETDVDDPMEATQAYSEYLVHKLTVKTPERMLQEVTTASTADTVARGLVRPDIATYFNWSFWSQERGKLKDWRAAFWEIRAQCGVDYADRLLAYMVKIIGDTPLRAGAEALMKPGEALSLPNPKTNWRIRIYLEQANKVVDNQDAHWPLIESVLVKRNLLGEP